MSLKSPGVDIIVKKTPYIEGSVVQVNLTITDYVVLAEKSLFSGDNGVGIMVMVIAFRQ